MQSGVIPRDTDLYRLTPYDLLKHDQNVPSCTNAHHTERLVVALLMMPFELVKRSRTRRKPARNHPNARMTASRSMSTETCVYISMVTLMVEWPASLCMTEGWTPALASLVR